MRRSRYINTPTITIHIYTYMHTAYMHLWINTLIHHLVFTPNIYVSIMKTYKYINIYIYIFCMCMCAYRLSRVNNCIHIEMWSYVYSKYVICQNISHIHIFCICTIYNDIHMYTYTIWFVVWNMFYIFPFSGECYHPN